MDKVSLVAELLETQMWGTRVLLTLRSPDLGSYAGLCLYDLEAFLSAIFAVGKELEETGVSRTMNPSTRSHFCQALANAVALNVLAEAAGCDIPRGLFLAMSAAHDLGRVLSHGEDHLTLGQEILRALGVPEGPVVECCVLHNYWGFGFLRSQSLLAVQKLSVAEFFFGLQAGTYNNLGDHSLLVLLVALAESAKRIMDELMVPCFDLAGQMIAEWNKGNSEGHLADMIGATRCLLLLVRLCKMSGLKPQDVEELALREYAKIVAKTKQKLPSSW